MFDWEFCDPWFLILLGLVPLIIWLTTRSTSILGFSSVELFAHTPRSLRQRLSILPPLLLAISFAALVIGLARPRTPQSETRVNRDGIAIMMVVDLSSSMDARDLVKDDRSINRLSVVKDVFTDFVFGEGTTAGKGRPDDLLGLVTFARYADSVCPLTLDHGNLANIVKDLEIVSIRSEDGTAVGDGLGLAVERLRRSKAKSKVAILLTDGVTNAGVIDPIKAAELAKQYDIKVYSIGVGTNGMAPYPSVSVFGRKRMVAQPVEIDEKTLQKIADETNGKYFRAVDKDALAEIYGEIDQMERTKVSELKYLSYTEHFRLFVLAGFGLLGFAMLLNRSIFRRLP